MWNSAYIAMTNKTQQKINYKAMPGRRNEHGDAPSAPTRTCAVRLPQDIELAICRDAVLMRTWQKQQTDFHWGLGPIFDTWMKVAYYEKHWPGSTEESHVGNPPVVWEP